MLENYTNGNVWQLLSGICIFCFCLEVNNMWPCVGAVRTEKWEWESFFFFFFLKVK